MMGTGYSVATTLLFFLILCVVFDFDDATLIKNLDSSKASCREICSDRLFILPKVKDAEYICYKGCNMCEIQELRETANFSATCIACNRSCSAKYPEINETGACMVGCRGLLEEVHLMLDNLLIYFEEGQVPENLDLDPEDDMFPPDFASYNMMLQLKQHYKIPETKEQTMPIFNNNLNEYVAQGQESERKKLIDWLVIYQFLRMVLGNLYVIGAGCVGIVICLLALCYLEYCYYPRKNKRMLMKIRMQRKAKRAKVMPLTQLVPEEKIDIEPLPNDLIISTTAPEIANTVQNNEVA